MDQGFGIDIDKVLDDFEKNEDCSSEYIAEPIHSSSFWLTRNTTEDNSLLQNRNTPFYVSSHPRSDYVSLLNDTAEKICLADADFSASSSSLKSSVIVPVIVQQEKPSYDNSLCYNRFSSSQSENWFIEGAPAVGSIGDPILPNGFDHEEEEVLAVQVMTSLDKTTNFEIKLIPSDQASDAFQNDCTGNTTDCEQPVENNTESQPSQWQNLESNVEDTRDPEFVSGVNSLETNRNFPVHLVTQDDSEQPNEMNISDDILSETDTSKILKCISSNSSAILEDNFPVSSKEEFDSGVLYNSVIKDSILLPEQPANVVGFTDNESDIECDDIDSYLGTLKMTDCSDTSTNKSVSISCLEQPCDDGHDNTNESTNVEGLVDKLPSDVIANPAMNSVPTSDAYLINTGARPKVRDPVLVSGDENEKDETSTDVAVSTCILDDQVQPIDKTDNSLTDENFSSILVKTVAKVQEHPIDFSEASSDRTPPKIKTDVQQESDLLQTVGLESDACSSLAGKKQRPTSLNLSGCLSPGSSGAASTASAPPNPEENLTSMQPPSSQEISEKLVDLDINDTSPSALADQSIPSSLITDAIPNFADISEEDQMLGKLRPFWIPDVDAPNCMHCDLKFTVLKRRHHCRACGKVLCSQCCNSRAKLAYLDYKEARVCHPCLTILMKVSAVEHLYNPEGCLTPTAPGMDQGDPEENSAPGGLPHAANSPSPSGSSISPSPVHHLIGQGANPELHGGPSWSPNPNNPPEYCSKVPPLQQALSQRPPPTVLVPVGVLKRGDKTASGRREPKQVMFSDGIRPGGDLTDLDVPPEPRLPYRKSTRMQRRVDKGSPVAQSSTQHNAPSSPPAGSKRHTKLMCARGRLHIRDEAGPLPPLLSTLDFSLEDNLDSTKLLQRLKDETTGPAVFAVTKNLSISVKIIKLDCCMGQEVWCFSSNGMASVGQDEVLFLLHRLPDENNIPRDAFSLFTAIYDNATKGTWFNELGHLLFPEGLLGAREHAGVLFVRPTHQCQSKLLLPQPPHLVAVLIQKWEVPWAKVFPLRLLLRIGAEFRYYPCPLVSTRFRKPVYGEIGHTIMDVLADFRNYQYTLPVVPGVTVCMEDKKTTVSFPRNRYEHVMKLLNSSNDNVLGLGACFCAQADSHLVCMQNEDGSYQTQAINIQNTPHKVTGASFIVFSGALKSSSGMSGKSSIVEDGLLVQITQDSMGALKAAIRDMKDYLITCGQVDSTSTQEQVLLKWTDDDKAFNFGVRSPIDDRSLEGVESIRIQIGTDYTTDRYLVRWTEVFFLASEPASSARRLDTTDPCKLLEAVSQACCLALTPCLGSLMESGLTRIGLRVTMDTENVGYEIGANGKPLEGSHMVDLDSALIPLIMGGSSLETPLIVELIFHVLHK